MSDSAGHATQLVGGRLELHITVCARTRESDLVVNASASDRVIDLAQASAGLLHQSVRLGLWCERREEQLDPERTLEQSGIRWGDRLLLVPPAGEPTHLGGTARVVIAISGGPCAGERFELGEGSYTLGRDHSADIVIADPSISRHHLDLRIEGSNASVADAGSSNGTALNARSLPLGSFTSLGASDELELGRTLLRAQPIGSAALHGIVESGGHLDFNRPPRVNPPKPPFEGELPSPPSAARKGRIPFAASMVPLAIGLLLFLLLKSPVMLAVAGMSPLMAISTFLGDRRGGKKSFSRESAAFRAKLETVLAELAGALDAETVTRRLESPDAPALMERLNGMAPSLWERRPTDPDFLCLRLGVADLPCHSRVEMGDGGNAELRSEATARLADRATVSSVPLAVDLPTAGVMGLSGDHSAAIGLARWLVLQASMLHSPGELIVLAALTDRVYEEEWEWLKWLPHLRSDRLGLEAQPISLGRTDAEKLLAEIRDLAQQRRGHSPARSTARLTPPQVLILIDEDVGIDRALLTATLTDIADLGIAVLWVGRDARDLPGQTGAIVELESERAVLAFTDVASGQRTEDVSAEGMSVELAEHAARLLAPIRDIGELARAGDIPKQVGLLDLLDLLPPTADELKRRWTQWGGDLRSTVGVGTDGVLTLDLRSEGPHALIAGTTGSGKSELLRTFVAGAAAIAPPNRLSFLLVDYKGGAAFAPCAALPHVADIVSDLDEHLAERALTSLNAELKRRERILAEEGAKDLLELTRRNPDAAPPLLVIAVDEFAKLREEVPEFVDGVVDIAQRGRSLGVHMVLAAQTLRNAFTPAIRANTNLRLALRVSEESESDDMISSPLAAHIPSGDGSRGRAYARTGHGELREFQAAYVSGLSDISQQREMQIDSFDLNMLRASSVPHAATADSDSESDLVSLGEAAMQAQAEMGLATPSPPWLPVLPELLDLDSVRADGSSDDGVAIGLVDLPQLQRQEPLVLDLEGQATSRCSGRATAARRRC